MEGKKFVFVAGLHRSGTSLIAKCIANHPEVSSFEHTGVYQDEGQFLQRVYPRSGEPGGDAPGRLGFDRRAHLTEHSPLTTPENAQQLFNEWKPYWNLSKAILLEKSPPNIIRTRFLQTCFPNPYFIIVTRHPVANALATKKWCRKNPLSGIILNWVICHSIFENDKAKLANVLVIKYEDFTQQPEACLAQISQFMGIDTIPLVTSIDNTSNRRYFEQWNRLKSNYLGWLDTQMSALLFESRINRFGYSFREVEAVNSNKFEPIG